MKFNVFNIWEKIYKKVIIVIVIGITFCSVDWYLNLRDKSDTFIISTLYALFLFALGIYMNYMGNEIQEKFYDKKDCYLVLSRLKAIFKNMNLENYSEEDVKMNIISFKVFTSRTDGMGKVKPYVPEKGFKFKNRELDIEDEFTQKYSCLLNKLNSSIMNYISEKSITTKVNYPHINNILFVAKEWCCKYCELNKDEQENMEAYILQLYSELQNEINELELLMKKIIKLYRSYRKKIDLNIKAIERIYGKKLEYEFYKEDKYINQIREVRDIVEHINDKIPSNDEYDELSNNISEVRQDILSIYEKIESVEDNLTSEIDVAKNELLGRD
ncbi:hypothetical protein KPL37_07045 [Clostridium frigoris]|uniref:5-bromo-4-chloroindolyl phosphate hydrolysis protein n=1 Tax=Clostridium frigoris TaxID=205327 RepID=A0ABS6BRG1_9CLOT|nr:hypothetical protein [Clostridium frigoris]MBU3159511.1 hypothetical protein [Clostridium frigoris]